MKSENRRVRWLLKHVDTALQFKIRLQRYPTFINKEGSNGFNIEEEKSNDYFIYTKLDYQFDELLKKTNENIMNTIV